jgi:hypothetical protein
VDFDPDPARSEGHRSVLLLVLLLVVPVFGASGVLALAMASAWFG